MCNNANEYHNIMKSWITFPTHVPISINRFETVCGSFPMNQVQYSADQRMTVYYYRVKILVMYKNYRFAQFSEYSSIHKMLLHLPVQVVGLPLVSMHTSPPSSEHTATWNQIYTSDYRLSTTWYRHLRSLEHYSTEISGTTVPQMHAWSLTYICKMCHSMKIMVHTYDAFWSRADWCWVNWQLSSQWSSCHETKHTENYCVVLYSL
jgi:hypothetical protein